MNGNLAEFARYLGVNKSNVTRAVQAGRIQREADGSIDFDKAAAAWHATGGGRTDVSARHAQNRGAAIPMPHPQQKNATARQSAPDVANIDAGNLPAADDGAGRAKAKALLLHYENGQIKLEMALRRGLRYERSAVSRESTSLGATLRAGIERVIDQTAPRLAAASSELQRRQIIETEIKRLRWIIKRELPRALRRMKAEGARAGKGAAAE